MAFHALYEHRILRVLHRPSHRIALAWTDDAMPPRKGKDQSTLRVETITAGFALTITLRWDRREAFLQKKWAEFKQRGLNVPQKNWHGLRDGRILCYWDNPKDEHASNIRGFLGKDTTYEKMNQLDIIVITCHESCTIELSNQAFQSVLIERGDTTSYNYRKPRRPSQNIASPFSSSMFSMSGQGSTQFATAGYVPYVASTHQSSAEMQSRDTAQDYPVPEAAVARQAVVHDRPLNDGDNGGSAFQVSNASTSCPVPTKRPLTPYDLEDSRAAKRPKEKAALSQGQKNSSSGDSLERGRTIQISALSFQAPPPPGDEKVRTMVYQENHAETNLVRDHGGVPGPEVGRGRTEASELYRRVLELENANEESRKLVSDLSSSLSQSQFSEEALRAKLQTAEGECRELQQHGVGLQSALHKALQEIEMARSHINEVERKLREERTTAEVDRRKAEEEKFEAVKKWKESNRESEKERIRRMAAESVLLDVKLLVCTDGVALETSGTV